MGRRIAVQMGGILVWLVLPFPPGPREGKSTAMHFGGVVQHCLRRWWRQGSGALPTNDRNIPKRGRTHAPHKSWVWAGGIPFLEGVGPHEALPSPPLSSLLVFSGTQW